MASLFRRGDSVTLQRTVNGRRVWASLGNVSRAFVKDATYFADLLEQAAREGREAPAAATAWIDGLSDDLHNAFAKVGLAQLRRPVESDAAIVGVTVGKLFDDYIARRDDLTKRSKSNLRNAKLAVVDIMGGHTLAANVRPIDCADWRVAATKRYSAATVSGFVKKSRQVWADAVERGICSVNPWLKVKAGKQSNKSRNAFVDIATVARVMAEADWRWKLVIALCRFGGLRCPTEVYDLRWEHVLFDKSKIVVTSRKGANHDAEHRVIPMFPELRALLAEALAHRDPEDERVVAWWSEGYNPHTHFKRLVLRAGLTPWPRLMHNLRASRVTELADQFPAHVVTAWMGHSENVSQEHYRMTTDVHFDRAAKSAAFDRGMARNDAEDGRPTIAKSPENTGFLGESRAVQYPQRGANNAGFAEGNRENLSPAQLKAQLADPRLTAELEEWHGRACRDRFVADLLEGAAAMVREVL